MKINFKVLGLVVVLLLTLFVSGLIFFNLILQEEAFHWDEGHHALYGLWIARDIATGDWDRFWLDTHHQAYWGFVHSWLLGIFFYFFGFSFQTARTLSLVLFFVTSVLVYLTAVRIFDRNGWKVGLLASFFCLTSPLMITFSAQNMLEGLGAFLFLLAVYMYFQSADSKKWYYYVFFGLVMGISIITKYNYALFILLSFTAVIFSELLEVYKGASGKANDIFTKESKKKPKKEAVKNKFFLNWIYKNLLIAAPVFLISLWWFLGEESERKIAMLFWTKGIMEVPNVTGFWQNIFYYPWVIITDGFFSPWLGILALVAVIIPIAVVKNNKIGKLCLIVWVVLILSTFVVPVKFHRHFHNVLPIIFLTFSGSVFAWTEILADRIKKYYLAEVIILLIVILPAVFSLPVVPKMYSGNVPNVDINVQLKTGSPNMNDVLEFFRSNLPKDKSFSSAFALDVLSPYSFYFYFRDWQAPFFTRFQHDAHDPHFFDSEYFLTLELTRDSPYAKGVLWDSVNEWNKILTQNFKKLGLSLYKEKNFVRIGVKAIIYRAKQL